MKLIVFFILSVFIFFSCASDKRVSIQEKLEKPTQEFYLSTKTDTMISGKEGTMIYIEKGSFVDAVGTAITDSVVVTLKELYSIADILQSNTTMQSGDKLLETGGMIELRAYAQGNQLSLDYNKSVVVHFPKKNQNDSMRLFYGEENGIDQKIGWELEESSVPQLNNKIHYWYRKYDNLDDDNLYLTNDRHIYDTLTELFNFSKKEKLYFLNKTVNVDYEVKKDGKLVYDKIGGSIISRELHRKLKGVAENFPRCKPYTVNGKPIDMIGHFQIWSEIVAPKYMSNKNYLSQIENKISNQDSSKSSISVAELQYYIFDSKQLGWMNCDQFINPNPIKTDFEVKVPKSDNIFVKIVFTNYNTVMIGDEKKGKFTFDNLPLDEPVKVIAIDEEDGKPLVLIKDTKVSKKAFEMRELKPVSLEELKKTLEGLN